MSNSMSELGKKPKNIRSRNRQLIVDIYRNHDQLIVSEISDKVKLSRTTILKINQELVEEGFIKVVGKGDSTQEGGKKPTVYRFNAEKSYILTFYIQYDAVLFRLYDLLFKIVIEDSMPIRENADFDDISRKMQLLISRNIRDNERYAHTDMLACVVGVHGNIDLDTGICIQATHFASWGINNNLHQTLVDTLGLDCPIYLDNWIRLKTYREKRQGEVGSMDSAVVIDAGWHGVASGILVKGEVFPGRHYLSGEVGHFQVNPADQEACFCGSHGCFEKQVQIERFMKQVRERVAESPDSLLHGKAVLSLQSVLTAADDGDSLARELLDTIIEWFARLISFLLLFFDPEILLVEGDYVSGCSYFEEGIITRVRQITLPRITSKTVVKFNEDGADAVLKGAAIMAVDKYLQI